MNWQSVIDQSFYIGLVVSLVSLAALAGWHISTAIIEWLEGNNA